MEILKSASKIVFILITIIACIGFIFGKLDQANFMLLAGQAFSFYFANKGSKENDYLGK